MGVGEAPAAEIRHRIGLAPHDVVEDPEAEILHDRADAKNIMVRADDENGGVVLHRPARGGKPTLGETVVIGERGEFVPVVVHRVDFALVRAGQAAFELKIIGRVGEDQIDAGFGQAEHGLDAIAGDDPVERRLRRLGRGSRDGASDRPKSSTRNQVLDFLAGRPGAMDTHVLETTTRLTDDCELSLTG